MNRTLIPLAFAVTIGLTALLVAGLLFASDDSDLTWQINMLVIGYFCVTLSLMLVGYFQLTEKRIGLFMLMAGHLVWFAGPALMILIEGRRFGDIAHYRIPLPAVAKAAIMILIFLAINLATYWYATYSLPWRKRAFGALPEPSEARLQMPPWGGLAALFLFGMVPFLAFGGDFTSTLTGILNARSSAPGKGWGMSAVEASARGPWIVIGRSALVTFSALCWWCATFYKEFGMTRRSATVVGSMAVVGTFITYFDSGTRTWTLLIIGPAMLGVLAARLGRRNLIRGTLIATVLLVVAVVVVQVQRAYRFTAKFDDVTSENVSRLDDSDFFTETAIAVDLVPRRFPYVRAFWPALYLANPIPRILWEDKPTAETIRIHSLGRSRWDEYEKIGISRMPGVVGQHWLSWGWWGVLFAGVFWGWMHAVFERLYVSSTNVSLKSFFAILGLIWLFGSVRGLYPGFHYPLVLTGFVMLYLTLRKQKGASQPARSLLARVPKRSPPPAVQEKPRAS